MGGFKATGPPAPPPPPSDNSLLLKGDITSSAQIISW